MFKFLVHSCVAVFASVTFPFRGRCPCTLAICTHVRHTVIHMRSWVRALLAWGQCPGQYQPGRCPRAKQAQTPVRPGIVRHILSTFVDYSPEWCPRADNVAMWTYSPGWCPRADNDTVWTYSPGWCPRADNVTMLTYSPGSRANSIFLFFIQRGHRRSLPRKEESDGGHRIKRALYIGIKWLCLSRAIRICITGKGCKRTVAPTWNVQLVAPTWNSHAQLPKHGVQ